MRSQIIHLFKNDVHHFWREIGMAIAIDFAYGWHTATHGRDVGWHPMIPDFSVTSQLLALLVSVAFIFLIVRAVHADCPVGDRQFWVTRPYQWWKLLAAKFLFVICFVNAPLLVLQVFLLWRGGFWPPKYAGALLLSQFLWSVWIFLPVGMLAAITASIGQFILTGLGVLFYFVTLGQLITMIPDGGVQGSDIIPKWTTLILVYAAVVAVVYRQYAHRKTAWARTVVAAVAAAVPILFAVTPYRTIIAHVYRMPEPNRPLPVHLAFDPAKPATLKGGFPQKNKVNIKLPLLISGITEGSKVTECGILVEIKTSDGLRWESGWKGGYGELLPARPRDSETIAIEKDFFERVKSTPVDVHLTYALTPSRARQVVPVIAGPAPFTVPYDGQCFFFSSARNEAVCFFPPGRTQRMIVSARTDEVSCNLGENSKPLPVGTIAYGWVWQTISFGLNPVSAAALELSDFGDQEGRHFRKVMCPGTPITIYANWIEGSRYRADLEIHGIRLADYKLEDSEDFGVSLGVSVP